MTNYTRQKAHRQLEQAKHDLDCSLVCIRTLDQMGYGDRIEFQALMALYVQGIQVLKPLLEKIKDQI